MTDPFAYDTEWEAFKYRVAYREGYFRGYLDALEGKPVALLLTDSEYPRDGTRTNRVSAQCTRNDPE